MRRVFLIFLLFLYGKIGAQTGPKNTGDIIEIHASYGFILPQADLLDRFGSALSPGLQAEWVTSAANWIFGVGGFYHFGTSVKEDVLSPLRTWDGGIIANDRSFADMVLRQRGWMIGFHAGKLIPLTSANPRSGIRLTGGLGYLMHNIRIQDDPMRTVAALTGDLKRGYDRLTGGLALSHTFGFQHLSLDGRINFYLALEGVWGFTNGLRSFQYDTAAPTDKDRLDGMLGIRVAWTLPFYLSNGESIYY